MRNTARRPTSVARDPEPDLSWSCGPHGPGQPSREAPCLLSGAVEKRERGGRQASSGHRAGTFYGVRPGCLPCEGAGGTPGGHIFTTG